MQRALLVALALAALLVGCRVNPDGPSASTTQSASRDLFGKPLQGLPPTPLLEILEHPERFTGRTVGVEGHVARACTRKGCWMEIASAPGEAAQSCRVTFENYAFFVPKDAPGSLAHLEGKVVTSRIKPSHVEHLESEGARFNTKAKDGSAIEVQIVATGVELEKQSAPLPPHGARGT